MLTKGFSVCYSPLNLLSTKTQGTITGIKNKDDKIVKKLLAMGVHTGMQFTLEKRFPAFVIIAEHNQIAIDKNIANSIKVRVTQ